MAQSVLKQRTVYQCEFALRKYPNRACGLDGESFDHSQDECHHPLTLADAKLFAKAFEMLACLKRILNLSFMDVSLRERVEAMRVNARAILHEIEGG